MIDLAAAVSEPRRAGADGVPPAAVPIRDVVSTAVSRCGEVGNLVLFPSRLRRRMADMLVHFQLVRFGRGPEFPPAATAPKRCPFLERQRVRRKVRDRRLQRGRDVVPPRRDRFPGGGEDQVDGDVRDRIGDRLDGPDRGRPVVAPLERSQFLGSERLHAKADPVHARFDQDRDLFPVDVFRVRLHRELGIGEDSHGPPDRIEQPPQGRRWQMARRPPADEDGRDSRAREPSQLTIDRPQEPVDQVVSVGDDAEIAVPAPVPAKRNVDV